MSEQKGATYDPQAKPDPNCAACKQEWPIHVDPVTGERFHIDLSYTKEAGLIQKCPCDKWIEYED